MEKAFVRIAIILLAIAIFLIYCWGALLSTDIIIEWRHYLALVLFLPLPIFLFKNVRFAVLSTGIYLLLGFLNLISISTFLSTFSFNVGTLASPDFNILFLVLIVFYLILNATELEQMHHERKQRLKKN